MKTRNGFVSNSSTSSFIIVGTRMEKDEFLNYIGIENTEEVNIYDIINENDFDGDAVFDDDECIYFGEYIHGSESFRDCPSFEIKEFSQKIKNKTPVLEKLEKAGYKIKLHMGEVGDG